ncbi:class I ribonucleotide reductase maintenance protein YfaE [Neisseriaceae bacterium B1]
MPQISTDSKTFLLHDNETLLEALERTGHEIEYQCRSGYCGSCRTKILSGSVSYDEMPMAFLMPDEILPCCCRVKEDITIAVRAYEFDGDEPDLFAQ